MYVILHSTLALTPKSDKQYFIYKVLPSLVHLWMKDRRMKVKEKEKSKAHDRKVLLRILSDIFNWKTLFAFPSQYGSFSFLSFGLPAVQFLVPFSFHLDWVRNLGLGILLFNFPHGVNVLYPFVSYFCLFIAVWVASENCTEDILVVLAALYCLVKKYALYFHTCYFHGLGLLF